MLAVEEVILLPTPRGGLMSCLQLVDRLRSSLYFLSWVKISLLLAASLVLLIAACATVTQSNPDMEFQAMLGIRTDPNLRLQTQDDGSFVVLNHTEKTIFFHDDSLGLRAYKYDVSKKTWILTPVEPEILHPNQPVIVPPKDPYSFPFGAFEPWWFTEKGKLRLVVVGWTDPANPKGSQIAAYSDVEIR